ARQTETDPDLIPRGAFGPEGTGLGAREGDVEQLDRRARGKDALAPAWPARLLLLQRAAEEEGGARAGVEVHADAGDGEPARGRGADLAEDRLSLLDPHGGTAGTAGEQRDREHAREAPQHHAQAFAAATFGAEFTGPLLEEPDREVEPDPPDPPDPEVEPELPPVLLLPAVEVLPDEEPSDVAAGLDSPPSDFGLLEE